MKTVILTSCNNSVEAKLIQGNLANEGIESFVSNENYTSLYPNMNGAMGSGMQVFVYEVDAGRALEIIKGGDRSVHCPKCKSANVKQTISKNWYQKLGVLLLALITANPIGNIQSKYKCKDCGQNFVI